MADTIMQDTVMQDADMQDIDMQDTVMQDTTTQDTTTQDTTTQDTTTQDTTTQDTTTQDTTIQHTTEQDATEQHTIVMGLVRKIRRMKRIKKFGPKVVQPAVREDCSWRPSETFYLLHLYTTSNNVSRTKTGKIHYGEGVVATFMDAMTTESRKHTPGGALHASDPWYARDYNHRRISAKLRELITEEDGLAVELEAELNAHYDIVADPVAKQPYRFKTRRQRRGLAKKLKPQPRKLKPQPKELTPQPEVIITEKEIEDAERMLGEELVRSANQRLRLDFQKIKKPVIVDKTDT